MRPLAKSIPYKAVANGLKWLPSWFTSLFIMHFSDIADDSKKIEAYEIIRICKKCYERNYNPIYYIHKTDAGGKLH